MEIRLRRFRDLAYRTTFAVQGKVGILQSRFPATPADPDVFLAALRPGIATSLEEFSRHFDARLSPRFLFDEEDAAVIAERGPHPRRSALIGWAEDVLAGRFRVLGTDVAFDLSDGDGDVDWHGALVTDAQWPRVHWTKIPYRSLGHLGDIKTPWELARHQFLPLLGMAWRETGDRRYAEGAARLLRSFIAQNPPEVGIHYVVNMELGLRCLSWMWAHHLLRPASAYDWETRGLVHVHIHRMARHIAGNLAFTAATGPNNHLIGDSASLLVVALLYPELKEAVRWRSIAQRTLLNALSKQVRGDGMHFEGSFAYHRFVMEFAWTALLMLERNGVAPQSALQTMQLMSESLSVGLCPDGSLLDINDQDDATALPLSLSQAEATAALLAVGSVRSARGDWKAMSPRHLGCPPPAACWLLGRDGLAAYDALSDEVQPAGEAVLPASGLFVVRSGGLPPRDLLFVDNHPDPFPDSGHNHASLLQVQLWLEGRPILVDSGTGRYNAAGPYRNALRSTSAHNTLLVDGRGQAEPSRNFGWLSKAVPGRSSWLRGSASHPAGAWALFDGEHRCYPGLLHRRTVLWLPARQCLVVRDETTGTTGQYRTIEQNWHFAPDLLPFEGDLSDREFQLSPAHGSAVAHVWLQDAGNDEIAIERGNEMKPWTFFSPRYGEIVPKSVLTRKWQASGRTVRYTLVSAAGAVSLWGAPRLEVSETGFAVQDAGVSVFVGPDAVSVAD